MSPTLELMPQTFAIFQLGPTESVPEWVQGEFVSVTRTTDELSIVCEQPESNKVQDISSLIKTDADWRCFRVKGQLDFSLVGIIAEITETLAAANVPVFVISTFNTDFVLVKAETLDMTIKSLRSAGMFDG
jgi:hypothetical protein